MADLFAESGAGAQGCRLDWQLRFDDAADTVTVTATHTRFDGSPAPDPQQAQITFTLNGGASIGLNLLTGRLTNNQPFDGTATKIIGSGPRTRTNVRLQISANRAQLITHSTQYQPPAL
jgi:hypothetical protein